MHERDYWLGFSVFEGIGPKRFKSLLEKFGSGKNAWEARDKDLEEVIGKVITEKFVKFRSRTDLEDYREKLKRADVQFLTLDDKNYPELLKLIENPPFVLYYKGNIKALSDIQKSKSIAVVGTRKITSYGREVTTQITASLVSAGYTIVSGLAFGVDATAHNITVENKGITIAVLGCGVDCCSPRENQNLYNRILESGGVIVSEYPLSAPPSKGSFPSRNRIIAGLSQAVIVTEGAADSGALYTAENALKIGRPVFAVPGPITSSLSKGPHLLIAKGAKLVGGVEDIIKELGSTGTTSITGKFIKGETSEEQVIIDILQNESLHFDEILKLSNLEPAKLGVLLSIMELKGLLKTVGTSVFSLAY